mgnify:CR=1 FL=1
MKNSLTTKRTFLEKSILFFKGLLMGLANKVPGVSGGTVSFVLGFYEELIHSFQKINLKAFKLLIHGKFSSFYKYTNAQFLLLVMGGSIFSYFSVSMLLDYFLQHFELYVWSWFFGMIIGSVMYMVKKFGEWDFKKFIFLSIGVSVGIAITFLNSGKENDNLWFVFLCGMIGVSGMTLPGLSGSFILMLIGNYVLLLVDAVNVFSNVIGNILIGNFDVLNDVVKQKYLKILAVFTAGSVVGLVSISHVLGYVLKRWKTFVNAMIIGFITGSLGTVWPWKITVFLKDNDVFVLQKNGAKIVENYHRYLPNFQLKETWVSFFFIIIGIGLILYIDHYEKKTKTVR